MEKPATTDYGIHELMRRRWSPVAFSPEPVDAETLATLFEAARWAPSSRNEQPWRFIIATRNQPADFDRVLDCLAPPNREWARHAFALVLNIARQSFTDSGQPNRHAFYDLGAAVENLILQAMAAGLFAHQMGGFDVERARQELAVPDGFEPVAVIALGRPGRIDDLPPDLRERQCADRQRRPLAETVFQGQWGRPFTWPQAFA